MIECKKDNCKKHYIGETDRELAERFSDHRGYVINKHLNQPTCFHFNQPGHDISVIVLEKVEKNDEIYRKQRKKYLINKFNTFRNGMAPPRKCGEVKLRLNIPVGWKEVF